MRYMDSEEQRDIQVDLQNLGTIGTDQTNQNDLFQLENNRS